MVEAGFERHNDPMCYRPSTLTAELIDLMLDQLNSQYFVHAIADKGGVRVVHLSNRL